MKAKSLTLALLLVTLFSYGQQWTAITNEQPSTFKTTLLSSSESSIIVNVQTAGFYATSVVTPQGEANLISVPKAVSTSQAGEPHLPMIAIPVIVGDWQHYSIHVKDAKYLDYAMDVAPSKGDFSRQINPDDVPYTYGEAYSTNAFFPTENVGLYEPYILRDFRGQNMVIHPFAYNPVSKTLRVYYDMTVELFADGTQGENRLDRKSNTVATDAEFKTLYETRFINYSAAAAKYTPVTETGHLLIICHDAFMSAMQPYVDWKKQIGRPTTMVGTSVSGSTSDVLKNYIQAQYQNDPLLTHILLVGDNAQVQGYYAYNGSYSGRSDNWYGQVAGNDYYNDIIVGRFSAESNDDVTTQVNKVLNYERDLDATATWITKGSGVATQAGNNGHFNEDDWQHIDNIRNDLLGFGYTEVYRDYQNAGGAQSSASALSQHINEGVSMINYCNHGSETSWGVFNYSNSNVNALTNDNKLPIVWSVACLNGKYDYYTPCFAEAWMRANHNNNVNLPTGAIGGMFSYISQPWVPPMYGQDEMVDIFVESNAGNIKRTLGGISFDGNMKILDQYGTNNSSAMGTYMCWILYGDPTLMVRNAVPTQMNVSHAPVLNAGATQFTVNATNGNDALATLSFNGEIVGSATINNGSASLSFSPIGQPGQATLTVIGHNKVTYTSTVNVTSSGNDPLSVTVSASTPIIAQGSSTTLNAQATGGNWTFDYAWTPAESLNNPNSPTPIATPTATTTYTCTVTSNNQTESAECTVEVVCPPSNVTATLNGHDVELTWDPANPAEYYKIYRNNTLIAPNVTGTSYTDTELASGTYNYRIASVYQNITSPKSETVTVSIQATISVNAEATPAIIPLGESATLRATVTGGTGSIVYQWTPEEHLNNPNSPAPIASPLQTTLYSVTVTRNGNTATDQVQLTVVTPPTGLLVELEGEHSAYLTWNAATHANFYNVYDNDSLVVSELEGLGITVEPLEGGTHCFTVTALYEGVESPASNEFCVEVFECRPPENFNATYYWEDGHFGALLTWDKNENVNLNLNRFFIYRGLTPSTMSEIGELVNVPYTTHYQYFDETTEPRNYYYMIKASYGSSPPHYTCSSETLQVEVTNVTEQSVKCQIHPNPTNNLVHIDGVEAAEVNVFNTFGQRVMTLIGSNDILLEGLPQGIYQLRITDAEGNVFFNSVIKR